MNRTHFIRMLFSFLFMLNSSLNAQPASIIKEVSVGEKCPDLEFNKIINFPVSKAKLSDFKGKLIILDFWATWCSPCVKSLQKLDSLQKLFGVKLLILPITDEKSMDVVRFMKTNKTIKSIQLPSVVEDTVLERYFRHGQIPHEIWIGTNGFVKAITGSEEINAVNIQHALNSDSVSMTLKKDILGWTLMKPLLQGGLGDHAILSPKTIKYSSFLSGYIEGMPSVKSGAVFILDSMLKFEGVNTTIDDLYQSAFTIKKEPIVFEKNPGFYLEMKARTIYEVKDSSFLRWRNNTNTLSNRDLYCYELMLPKSDPSNINAYMIADLNKYFGVLYGIEAVLEKRKVRCWALIRNTSTDLMHTKGGPPVLSESPNGDSLIMVNNTISKLLFELTYLYMESSPIPIIDETIYTMPVDLKIEGNLTDPISVGNSLRKYGLDFIQVERELEMIVIRNIRNSPTAK
jgi:thiol-disulfide isomerase/thioredoxin